MPQPPSDTREKTYLGDGGLVLTTENGRRIDNRIVHGGPERTRNLSQLTGDH